MNLFARTTVAAPGTRGSRARRAGWIPTRKLIIACASFGLLAASVLANSTAPAGATGRSATTVAAGPFNPVMTNRENVRQLFYSAHEAAQPQPMGWTGN